MSALRRVASFGSKVMDKAFAPTFLTAVGLTTLPAIISVEAGMAAMRIADKMSYSYDQATDIGCKAFLTSILLCSSFVIYGCSRTPSYERTP